MSRGQTLLAAAVRIGAGLLLVAEGASKLAGDFVHRGFASSAQQMARQSWPFWRSILHSAVIPHAALFAWAVALGELAVGIGLMLGLLARAAALGGVFLMVVILLGQSYVPGSGWDRWLTAGLTTKFALLLFLLLFAADAGRAWGLDSRVKRVGRQRLR